ncbi:multidrug MFS transporter [Bacillus sp. MUM 116]|uniref:sugar transferase n=1 Tax=Bacillus sp. MUM 116 TaxID=1678002 RepID=UPI0008F5D453|nr:sugar transferase [Bacillus sp. MUM 116]OIK10585.1 multidrug MFS transporter [Bacillus sp. MUM 116]
MANSANQKVAYLEKRVSSANVVYRKKYLFIKRLIDIVGAAVGILLTLPCLIVLSSFYLLGPNKGPIFFKQIRLGKNGEKFYIYKFRSMVVDAENKLKENKDLYQKYIKSNFKLEQNEDPRITSFGRFIRKTSLDELPQFFNVLKGDMSLVGPRPVVLEELNEYKDKKSEFLSVKPGITGYWQVCGRSDVGYPERVNIELYYVYNQSLLLDVKIILKTIFQVIVRKGAY